MDPDEAYRNLVRSLKGSSLLALPQTAAKVLQISKRPDAGPPEYAAAIGGDVGLTSQIMRFVNSSYFGFRHKVTTLQAALALVYGPVIRNFIVWNAVFAILPNPKCGPFDLNAICQDGLRRGIFARTLGAFFKGLDPEVLFLGALFQDLALPILAENWPLEYAAILGTRQDGNRRISELEQETFGWNHADAGSYLVIEWGFDPELADDIEGHIDPVPQGPYGATSPTELRNIITALSSLVPSVLDVDWYDAESFFQGYARIHRKGMPYPHDLFETVDFQVAEMAAIARLDHPPKTLTEFHRQYLAK